jgi:hypothetical protein
MAAKRKGWQALSPGYRARLSRAGITEKAYGRGESIRAARGHKATPEHGIKEATRSPATFRKFRKYVESNAQREAEALNSAKDKAYANIKKRLGSYDKYRDKNVKVNVYGGVRGPQIDGELEFTEVDGMGIEDAIWTASADTESLRSRASRQSILNPWFYH